MDFSVLFPTGQLSVSGHTEKNSLGGGAIPECYLLNVHTGKYNLPFWSLIPTSSTFSANSFLRVVAETCFAYKDLFVSTLCYPSVTTGLRLVGGDHLSQEAGSWMRSRAWTQLELWVTAWCGKKKGPDDAHITERSVLKCHL